MKCKSFLAAFHDQDSLSSTLQWRAGGPGRRAPNTLSQLGVRYFCSFAGRQRMGQRPFYDEGTPRTIYTVTLELCFVPRLTHMPVARLARCGWLDGDAKLVSASCVGFGVCVSEMEDRENEGKGHRTKDACWYFGARPSLRPTQHAHCKTNSGRRHAKGYGIEIVHSRIPQTDRHIHSHRRDRTPSGSAFVVVVVVVVVSGGGDDKQYLSPARPPPTQPTNQPIRRPLSVTRVRPCQLA